MQTDIKANGGGAARFTAHAQKPSRKKRRWTAVAIGRFLTLSGMVAPGATTRVLKRLLFSPSRAVRDESVKVVLRAAKMDHFLVAGVSICRYRWGDGNRRVLLVHGWSGDATQMTEFVEPLCAQGCEVVAVDLPAHGASSGKLSSVAHFQEVIFQLHQELGPFHGVIAHSLGTAALTYALSRGMTCERAVFLGPVCSYDMVWANSQKILNVSPRLIGLTRTHTENWLNIKFNEIDPIKLAPALSTTLLVIHDRGDRECPIKYSESLVRAWPGAQLLTTEKLGHTRLLRDPEVTRQTANFICGA